MSINASAQPVQAVKYKALKIDAATKKKLQPAMTSWRTVYAFIRDLDDSNKNLQTLSNMLALEISNPDGPRHQILTRLHMRINAMRQSLEYSEVMKAAKR